MKFSVKIQPKSSKEAVEQLADGSYKIFVHSPPINGKANAAVACHGSDNGQIRLGLI